MRRSSRLASARIGRLEITIRIRPARPCGSCQGHGWNHSKGTRSPRPAPPGYDGVGLCPCGAALDRLSDSRRFMRRYVRRERNYPPF